MTDSRPHIRLVTDEDKRRDDEPAPREESLKWARWQLERLYGVDLETLEDAGEGECGDCGVVAFRLRFGRRALCRRCASVRRRARRGTAP